MPFMCVAPHAPLSHYDDNVGTLVSPGLLATAAVGEVTSGLVWVTGAVTHLRWM